MAKINSDIQAILGSDEGDIIHANMGLLAHALNDYILAVSFPQGKAPTPEVIACAQKLEPIAKQLEEKVTASAASIAGATERAHDVVLQIKALTTFAGLTGEAAKASAQAVSAPATPAPAATAPTSAH